MGRANDDGLGAQRAPLTVEVTLAVLSVNFPHGDPADHFIAATAKLLDLTLVTADAHLIGFAGIRVLANG